MQQPDCNVDATFHTARERLNAIILTIGKLNEIQDLIDPLGKFLPN
jgi:hypothetical protein